MYDVIILSDIFFGRGHLGHRTDKLFHGDSNRLTELDRWNFWSRYLGPYSVTQSARNEIPNLKIKVIDYFTRVPNFFEYLSHFVSPDTRYICLSTTFIQNVFNDKVSEFNLWFQTHQDLYEWFEKLKELAPNAEIVLGGHACDVYFRSFLKNANEKEMPEVFRTFVNHVFHGYGEDIFVDFLRGRVDPQHHFQRQGINFYSDDKKAGQGAQCLQVRWTQEEAVQTGEWLPLEISKGCRFGCKFCMFDRLGTTIKDKESLRSEFLYNYEKFGTQGYLFTDDTINDSLSKVTMIHDVVKSLPFKIEWISYARPDTFYNKPEMLDLLLDSGCRGMFLGIETFNAEAAKIAGKGLHPDKIKNILEMIKQKAGNEVFILGSFILGLVGETAESLEDTLQYLKQQKVIDKISFEVLYLRPPDYRTNLDNDFSANSEKYGFTKITASPYDWEHQTLNYKTCCDIKNRWKSELSEALYSGAESGIEGFTNFWSYPRIRSLGYTHKEAFTFLRTRTIPNSLYLKNSAWIANYHRNLLMKNPLSEIDNVTISGWSP